MSLTLDDEITVVELVVILLGLAITWAIYRDRPEERDPSDVE